MRLPHFKIVILSLTFLAIGIGPSAAQHRSAIDGSVNTLTCHVNLGGIGGYVNVGAGLEYERFTRDGHISFTLPFDLYYGGTIEMGEQGYGDPTRTKLSGFYVAPGLKYHPFSNDRTADLGLGMSMALGNDKRRDHRNLNGFSPSQNYGTQDLLCMAQGQISLNLQSSRKFIIGFFLTGSYMLSHTHSKTPINIDDKDWALQFGLKLGGRF